MLRLGFNAPLSGPLCPPFPSAVPTFGCSFSHLPRPLREAVSGGRPSEKRPGSPRERMLHPSPTNGRMRRGRQTRRRSRHFRSVRAKQARPCCAWRRTKGSETEPRKRLEPWPSSGQWRHLAGPTNQTVLAKEVWKENPPHVSCTSSFARKSTHESAETRW